MQSVPDMLLSREASSSRDPEPNQPDAGHHRAQAHRPLHPRTDGLGPLLQPVFLSRKQVAAVLT